MVTSNRLVVIRGRLVVVRSRLVVVSDRLMMIRGRLVMVVVISDRPVVVRGLGMLVVVRDRDRPVEIRMNKQSCQGQEMQQVMVMPPQCYDVIFQGDNVDKNVHVRDMRVDNPNTSLHYFNSYAVKDRVPCPSSTHVPAREGATCSCYEVDSAQVPKDLRNAPCTTFLPSVTDCKNLRDSYIRIVATVLVENFTFLHQFKECIPLDLNHKYSDHMAKKSEIVS